MQNIQSSPDSPVTEICTKCGTALCAEEVALTKKLVSRGMTKFYCYDCLGKHFQITKAQLKEQAERFRKAGCVLFQP